MFIVKIFIAALVILAKNWKVLKNSLIVEWINKCSVFYCMIIHTNVFYCVITGNIINLTNILLSKRSHIQKISPV